MPALMAKRVTKRVTIRELEKISKQLRDSGKTIGLITGCFDILHTGHIEQFILSKEGVDVLLVGVESDHYISLAKGEDRPVNKRSKRIKIISEIKSIDYVFPIRSYNPEKADYILTKYYKRIRPHYLITNPNADEYWEKKKKCADSLNIKILLIERPKITSSTDIIKAFGL